MFFLILSLSIGIGQSSNLSVNTLEATGITYNSVVLNGELINISGSEEVDVYFRFIEKGEPFVGHWPSTDKFLMNETGKFNYELSELNYNSTYEFLAVAECKDKYVEGKVKNFTTEDAPDPKIESIEAEEIDYDSAMLKGNLFNVKDEEIDVFFRYREIGEDWSETSAQRIQEGEFTESIEDLNPETGYEFKAVMKYEEEEKGDVLSFSTLEEPSPEVKTLSVKELTSESAILEGKLIDIGLEDVLGISFQYREKGDSEWVNETELMPRGSEGIFTKEVFGLKPENEYEFRALARWEDQNTTGEVLDFSTLEMEGPLPQTKSPVNVTHDSAILKSDLIDLRNITEVDIFFRYREKEEDWIETTKRNISSEGEFEERIDNLNPETLYEFKVVVEWEEEELKQNIGGVNEFETTEKPDPELEFLEVTEISYSSAKIESKLVQTPEPVNVFFRYREEGNNWINTSEQKMEEVGVFEYDLIGLSEETVYEFKPVVEWNGEELTGEVIEFVTPKQPSVSTLNYKAVTSNSVILKGELMELGDSKVELLFRYRKENEEWVDTSPQEADESIIFDERVENLEEDSEYEFKAVVRWDDGDYELEGDSIEFRTLESLDAVTPTFFDLLFLFIIIVLGILLIFLGRIRLV